MFPMLSSYHNFSMLDGKSYLKSSISFTNFWTITELICYIYSSFKSNPNLIMTR